MQFTACVPSQNPTAGACHDNYCDAGAQRWVCDRPHREQGDHSEPDRRPVELTAALVDIESVSRDEALIADVVEAALREQTSGFEVIRHGNCVLARTSSGPADAGVARRSPRHGAHRRQRSASQGSGFDDHYGIDDEFCTAAERST